MNAKTKYELNELLYVSLEGMATDEQMKRLNHLIASDPEALSHSLNFYMVASALKKTNTIADAFLGTKNEKIEQFDILRCLAAEEKTAPAVEISVPKPLPAPTVSCTVEKRRRQVSKVSFVMGVMSLAALLFMVAYVSFIPSREAVAQIVNVMDVQVTKGFKTLQKGDLFYNTDKPVQIEKGYVEIAFDYGAIVILEGPCEFACKANGALALSYGRSYAFVPEEASGFTVITPSSRIVDLGTEFGVEVELNGSSTVSVYKGQTRLIPSLQQAEKTSETLDARQSRTVDAATGAISVSHFREDIFVRYFNPDANIVLKTPVINLAEVVGGGNGLTSTSPLESGVDPGDGKQKVFTDFSGQVEGPDTYSPVRHNPFIDGVFIPNGENRSVVISSKNHVFEQCPVTNGKYWGGIINGAVHQAQLLGIPKHHLRLRGITYGTPETPSIYIHANQGITFDLDAFRQSFRGLSIDRFTAVCGVSESLNDYHDRLKVWTTTWNKLKADSSSADFYVLIDGQVRFNCKELTVRDGAVEIAVDIRPEDRFLTLVTTQGSDPWGNTNDWTLFGVPYLHVSPFNP
jgi:hypothetical protein